MEKKWTYRLLYYTLTQYLFVTILHILHPHSHAPPSLYPLVALAGLYYYTVHKKKTHLLTFSLFLLPLYHFQEIPQLLRCPVMSYAMLAFGMKLLPLIFYTSITITLRYKIKEEQFKALSPEGYKHCMQTLKSATTHEQLKAALRTQIETWPKFALLIQKVYRAQKPLIRP